MAYVEAGPADGEPVLLLHGEPSWSFLYRTVLRVLLDAGLRVIAADMIGFGRSDKPAEMGDHSFARHVDWTRALAFDSLGLTGLTLVGQDWGGLIGLRRVAEHPDRFARVVAANTGLPTGDQQMPEVWLRFRDVVAAAPQLGISRLVQAGCRTVLAEEVLAAYEAPFPDESFKAGPRAMPTLVPTRPDDPASAANRAAGQRAAAPGALGQAVPGRVRGLRPDPRRDGAHPQADRARRGRPGSPRHRERRPLPAGGRRRAAGHRDRRLRPRPLTRRASGVPPPTG